MSVNLPQQWLAKAAEDLVVAQLILPENHLAHVCFLSHQCIEKALKAYLIAKINQYPRTHKLVDLLQQCMVTDPNFSQFLADCISVDQYYIPTRYPDGTPGGLPSGLPTTAQAQKATAADEILRHVTAQLASP
jgi:HEPN domain-containing protein